MNCIYTVKKSRFFTVQSTGSLRTSTFYCKLTENVKLKDGCIFYSCITVYLDRKTTVKRNRK
jgi:hypothetical protein